MFVISCIYNFEIFLNNNTNFDEFNKVNTMMHLNTTPNLPKTNSEQDIAIHYVLDFTRCHEHLIDVIMSFDVADIERSDDGLSLWLPTWIAGSYLVREFSKNITKVIAYDEAGRAYRASKSAKNRYEFADIGQAGRITVHYEVYCHDLSVRTAFVDDSRLFGNFTSLLLMVSDNERASACVHLHVPQSFLAKNQGSSLACGLPHVVREHEQGVGYSLAPKEAFEYYDYPFEFGVQSLFDFTVQVADKGVAHRFFIAGRHRADLTRLSADVQKICQSYADLLGDVPFTDYTFMTMVTGSDYGGLEHVNSTALITPRSDLPVGESDVPSESYQRFLGLCSHEYFHAWWVKSVRPDVMMDSDLQTETYTPLLWVFEGFTSYLDDLMLLVSGVIDRASYFKLITAQINRYYKTDGRRHQSVAESSFDTWIKLYRPDENTANQSVSYYNKGALVALCLDLSLLKHSGDRYRLFDVVKAFYDKSKQSDDKRFGMTDENLSDVISSMMGADAWQDFYHSYVVGTDELPLVSLMGELGAVLDSQQTETAWGMSVDENADGLKIKHLHRGSIASGAGLSVGDVIIAIDGIRASGAGIKSALTHADSVVVHAFRRDELRTFTVTCGTPTRHESVSVRTADYQEKGWLVFDKWLKS
ncbi:M61 family peptidase [Moraxella bovis]|nr:M61 family peptidase [Moraxella bovis]